MLRKLNFCLSLCLLFIFFNSSFFSNSAWALGTRQEIRQERRDNRQERREERQEADETTTDPAVITPAPSVSLIAPYMMQSSDGSWMPLNMGEIFSPPTPSSDTPQSTEVIPSARTPILSPEQRAEIASRLRERFRFIISERLTPERKEELRGLFRQWWAEWLTQERRDMIRSNIQTRVHDWRDSITPAQRDEFHNKIKSRFESWLKSVPESQKEQWKARLREIIIANIPQDVLKSIIEDTIREFLKDAGDTIINIPTDVWDTLSNTATDAWGTVEDTWKDIFGPVEDAVISPTINWVDDNVLDPVKKVWDHWF